jgi:hypothetical protein
MLTTTRRTTTTALLAVALTIGLALGLDAAAIGASSPDHARAKAGVTGTWKGKVHGDAGSSGAYPAKVKITKKKGKLRATIKYPGYCSGVWKFRGKKKGWFTFREVIKHNPGGCVTPVAVKAKRAGAKLKVVWREPRTGDVGQMRAHRI